MAFEIDQSSLRQLSRRPTTRQCRSERVRLIIAVAYGRLFSLFLLLRLFLSIHFFVSVRMVRATLSLFLVSSHATVEKYPHLGKQPSLLLSKYLAKVWLLRTFGDFGRSPQPEWNRFGFRLFRYFSAPVQFFVSETSFGWVFFFLAERKLSLLKIIASLFRFVWRAFFLNASLRRPTSVSESSSGVLLHDHDFQKLSRVSETDSKFVSPIFFGKLIFLENLSEAQASVVASWSEAIESNNLVWFWHSRRKEII